MFVPLINRTDQNYLKSCDLRIQKKSVCVCVLLKTIRAVIYVAVSYEMTNQLEHV